MASEAFEQLRTALFAMPRLAGSSLEDWRVAGEGYAMLTGEPAGVTYAKVAAGAVPAEWAIPSQTGLSSVLYLHGGGHCICSPASHRKFVGHLANALRARVLLADYRLAPEHPYPAALDDALATYEWLIDAGADPASVVIAGDSSGGGLATATLIAIRDGGLPTPGAAVLFSPWVDLTCTSTSFAANADLDPIVDRAGLLQMADWYLGGGDPAQPLVSPVNADLRGLPPLLIQVGEHEVLIDDAERLYQRASDAGVDVTLKRWPEMTHVFQIGAGNIPEADAAIIEVAGWLATHCILKV